jgi:sodium-dependent dicarboxylate transporter 2/3/5
MVCASLLRGLGLNISVHSIALISSTIVLVPCFGVLTWEDVYSDVDLGSILVIATGMSLGHALLETGAIRWLGAWVLIPIMTMTPCVRIFLAAVGISVLKTFLSSNTVAGAVLVPLVVAMAGSLGKRPLLWYGLPCLRRRSR